MTPEERKLVTDLFDRLATLEDAPRDPEAERAIRDGLRQAPNAVYALVQTTLVQDEALKRADARIRDLEGGGEPPRDTSFLGGVRDTLLGSRDGRGSVPSVRPPDAPGGLSPAWRSGAQPMAPAPEPAAAAAAPGRPGSSFLGTAAAAAAGMIGGSLLLSGIRGMMGGGSGGAHAAFDPTAGGRRWRVSLGRRWRQHRGRRPLPPGRPRRHGSEPLRGRLRACSMRPAAMPRLKRRAAPATSTTTWAT